jgi:hypothetical protein
LKKSILALGLTFATLSATAATTATLVLKGTVPAVLSISLVAETLATNLPLTQTQAASKVATVTESSNSASGYKVTISSINAGKLVRANGTEQFPYTLSYGSQAGINLTSQYVASNPQGSAVNRTQDVKISYQGVPAEQMVAGDYTDTLTFTIAAN